jgi:hypothetical protein
VVPKILFGRERKPEKRIRKFYLLLDIGALAAVVVTTCFAEEYVYPESVKKALPV